MGKLVSGDHHRGGLASRPVWLSATGGLRLVGDAWGDPEAPPVVMLHGAGQTRHAWGVTAEALAGSGWYVVAVDLRGHGDSDWPRDAAYSLEAFAEDVVALTDSFGEPPVVVGASLGGLAALVAQGGAPRQLYRALVLVDITPKLEANGVQRVLRFMAAHLDGFRSLEEASAVITRYLPDRPARGNPEGLTRVLRQTADGRWRWRWDPRFATALGDLAGEDPHRLTKRTEEISRLLTNAARRVQVPTLIVRGGRSDVTSDHGVAEFLNAVPHADHVTVGEAGHMVAGDHNDAFTAAVAGFLRRLTATPGLTP